MDSNAENAIKNVINNKSWFRESPHYWMMASLPFAYATACVEVVSANSEKAGSLYLKIVEAWDKPGVKVLYKELFEEITDLKREEIKQAFIHPEIGFLPNPDKPFKDIEEMLDSIEINDEVPYEADYKDTMSKEDWKNIEEITELVSMILEFIIIGFNRESDIEKGHIRVIPSEKHPWLILAIIMKTSFEHANITLENIRNFYKKRKYKGEVIDFNKVLTEQPMSRMHRRMVASSKKMNMKLINDRKFINAAKNWYQCRIGYSSINKYCDALAEKGIIQDPKNINKQIRPCDEAVGYVRRLPKKK